ncbi:MAG: ribosomal L7Ae/L30e/S12e/Gadd45 family protein [Clostridia bacterium]|nr:ribosomal L7Ae/L30e/S12e/Gadd45 family protein [Clostridia bacterium]
MTEKEKLIPATPEMPALQAMPSDPKEAEAMLRSLQAKKKFPGLLGIAKKAGKVIAGTNLTAEAVRSGAPAKMPHAVFVACDASENTKKRITNCCTYYEVPFYEIPLDTASVGNAIGKSGSISVVGVTDRGLADALVKLIKE